jgi:hypothetical protein
VLTHKAGNLAGERIESAESQDTANDNAEQVAGRQGCDWERVLAVLEYDDAGQAAYLRVDREDANAEAETDGNKDVAVGDAPVSIELRETAGIRMHPIS